MKIDLEQIRDLLKAVSQTDITELTIESGDEKITVKKSTTVVAVAHSPTPVEINATHVPQVAARPVAVATLESFGHPRRGPRLQVGPGSACRPA